MVQFFLTHMGKKFFEADVPRLIRALEGIAEGLRKPPKVLTNFNGEVQRAAAALMKPMTGKPGAPLIVGDLAFESLAPDSDIIRITSKEGHVVEVFRPGGEHAVYLAVDNAFEIRLGESFDITEEP